MAEHAYNLKTHKYTDTQIHGYRYTDTRKTNQDAHMVPRLQHFDDNGEDPRQTKKTQIKCYTICFMCSA